MLPASYLPPLTDLLYTQAKGFVGIYDLQLGWFTQVNAAAVKLLGYPSEQVFLDDPDHSLRKPPWTPVQWQVLCERARQEGRQEVETEIRCYSGESFRGHIKFSYFEIERHPLFLITLTEVNRLQQAERALAHSVRRFEAVFTNATIGIIVCDRPGAIVATNQLAEQLFGYEAEELLGQLIEILVPQAPGRHHEKLRGAFNAQPQVRDMGAHRALLGQRKDGSVFPVEISLSYFHLDQELHVVAYILDLTAKKAAEEQLAAQQQRVVQLNADLEQKVADRTHALLITLEQLEKRGQELAQALATEQELGELKSRFVSIASHEFRTPLTVVLTSATLIEEYANTNQQSHRLKHVQRIRSSVKHLNDILEEFLSVGRIEEGNIEAHPAAFDLTDLLTETLADVQGLLKPGQVVARQVQCPTPLRLDPSLMRKILVNLLSNAIKYSGENSIITVGATCARNQLTVWVKDTGIGISAEDQAQLFKPFSRAGNVTNVLGTGLGLYIVAKYLELMKGTISLHSELHHGTTVTITIPYENDSAD
ncbi:MAG: PAS domain S-box protein [Hymenobacteraceae bacterium]|nr:PAS domain S-box protein [Hymenobacteraceae bacterium]